MHAAPHAALALGLALSLLPAAGRAEVPGAEAPVDPAGFGALDGLVLFSAWTASTGRELWRTDGTGAGTARVAELAPGPTDAYPGAPVVVGGRAFLTATDGPAVRLWVTDGTAAGTRRAPLFPEGDPLDFDLLGAVPGALTAVTSRAELWQSDGDRPATLTFSWADHCHGSACGVAVLVPHGGDLYAIVYAKPDPSELWRLPGAGPGQGDRLLRGLGRYVGELPAGLLFSGVAGPLWLADAGGARVLHPVDAQYGGSGDSAVLAGALIFAGRDDAGVQPWRSDGTEAGTVRFARLPPAPEGYGPFSFTRAGDRVFFYAWDATGVALWVTDGTAAGTRSVLPGVAFAAPPAPLGGAVIVGATVDGVAGLWRSDGTPAGTVRLAPLAAAPRWISPVGALVYLGADGGDGQLRPWRSDGTPASTLPLAEAGAAVGSAGTSNAGGAGGGGGGCGSAAPGWPAAALAAAAWLRRGLRRRGRSGAREG